MDTTKTTASAELIDAVEVQERLDWQAMRAGQAATVTIDTAILDFLPNGPHQVAAMANLGAELLQEIQAYRPQFLFKSSPAEIVGALIEEMAAPTIEVKPQLAPGEREAFDAWFGDTSKRGYVNNEVSAFSGWLAAKRAALAAAQVQPVTVPDGWCQFIDGVKTQNVARDAKELNTIKSIFKVMAPVGAKAEYRPFYFAAPAAQDDTKDAKLKLDAACRSLEHYADSYEQMGRISNDGKVECASVAHDIRLNMVDAVRAAFAVSKAGA